MTGSRASRSKHDDDDDDDDDVYYYIGERLEQDNYYIGERLDLAPRPGQVT